MQIRRGKGWASLAQNWVKTSLSHLSFEIIYPIGCLILWKEVISFLKKRVNELWENADVIHVVLSWDIITSQTETAGQMVKSCWPFLGNDTATSLAGQ